MPKFSKRSIEHLQKCHVDLQTLMNEVIKTIDITVMCGHRGEKEQNEAFDKGYSKLKYPESKHNKTPSLAVDVVPYPTYYDDVTKLKEMGLYIVEVAKKLLDEGKITHEIRWGGDWDSDGDLNDQTFIDYPHFEIQG